MALLLTKLSPQVGTAFPLLRGDVETQIDVAQMKLGGAARQNESVAKTQPCLWVNKKTCPPATMAFTELLPGAAPYGNIIHSLAPTNMLIPRATYGRRNQLVFH